MKNNQAKQNVVEKITGETIGRKEITQDFRTRFKDAKLSTDSAAKVLQMAIDGLVRGLSECARQENLNDKNSDYLKIYKFGSFKVRQKKERPGLNPKEDTKGGKYKIINVSARKVVTFKASEILQSRVNNENDNP